MVNDANKRTLVITIIVSSFIIGGIGGLGDFFIELGFAGFNTIPGAYILREFARWLLLLALIIQVSK